MLPGTSQKNDWRAYTKGVSLMPTSKIQCITNIFTGFHTTTGKMCIAGGIGQLITAHSTHALRTIFTSFAPHQIKPHHTLTQLMATSTTGCKRTTSLDIAEAINHLLTDNKDDQQSSDLTCENWSHMICATIQHQRSIGPHSFTKWFLFTH